MYVIGGFGAATPSSSMPAPDCRPWGDRAPVSSALGAGRTSLLHPQPPRSPAVPPAPRHGTRGVARTLTITAPAAPARRPHPAGRASARSTPRLPRRGLGAPWVPGARDPPDGGATGGGPHAPGPVPPRCPPPPAHRRALGAPSAPRPPAPASPAP